MVNRNGMGRATFFAVVFSMGLSCIGLLACGGNEESDQQTTGEVNAQPAAEQSSTADVAADIPSGWKPAGFQGWNFAIPGNWNGDDDVGVWWHGEGDMHMGRPPVSVHCGGIPVMPNSSFEDKLMARTNDAPQERKTVSVAGHAGCTCTWEVMGKKHFGLFLEEKTGGGMSVVHFVDCQAPATEFDQYKGDFENIIASVHK